MTFHIGDKAKLTYRGFRHCKEGSIVLITNITPDKTIDIKYKGERFVVSDIDLIELVQKEKVDFT